METSSLTLHGMLDGHQLVDVEQEPRQVADQEDHDETHEDHGQVVLLLAPGLVDGDAPGGGLLLGRGRCDLGAVHVELDGLLAVGDDAGVGVVAIVVAVLVHVAVVALLVGVGDDLGDSESSLLFLLLLLLSKFRV